MDADQYDSAKFISRFFFKALALIVIPLTVLGVVSLTRDPAPVASAMASTVNVSLSEYAISGQLNASAGDVTMAVTNKGSMEHNLTLQGGATTGPIPANGSANLALGTLEPGSYTLICTIPGHTEAGMKATLVVDKMDPSMDHSAAQQPGTTAMDYTAMDAAMEASIKLFPAKTIGKGNQTLAPKVLPDGTKEFALTAAISDWEVSPGKVVKAWTYNGQVPGPEIRTDVGDKVRVVLTNHLPMGTDVHFHGFDMPFAMDGVSPITQDLVKVNGTFTYEFTATKPAVGMYHAHHHAQTQVPNGLFGAFYVGEMPLPAGRTISGTPIPADIKVDRKITMVLNDAGVIGLSLNGKSFPATEPYVVKNGQWIEASYFNEGLLIHPMHQHQFPQLVIAKDGIPLDQPYFVDTLAVAPGERYTVLMNTNKVGTWVWHCHILTHAESDAGMFGMVTALVVQ